MHALRNTFDYIFYLIGCLDVLGVNAPSKVYKH